MMGLRRELQDIALAFKICTVYWGRPTCKEVISLVVNVMRKEDFLEELGPQLGVNG
jgi:hypothetical protein